MPNKVTLTPFQAHKERWKGGCGAAICDGARRVYARGQLPCAILFIGEAPGESENVLGIPFAGPAGHQLDRIIKAAVPPEYRIAFTNLVCCIPRDEGGGKASEPDDESIECCAPRLQAFVEIADPQLIVCVGSLARDWTEPGYRYSILFHRTIPRISITHPAAIMRANVAQQGFMLQTAIVTLSNAVEEYVK